MQDTTKQRTALAVTVLFTAATLLVAALLIYHCLSIYLVGVSPANLGADGVRLQDIYTREMVAQHFGQMAWAVWLWAAALAAQIAVRLALPCALPKPRPLRVRETPGDAPAKPRYALLRIVLYAVALFMIVAGILNGGMRDVLVKAVNICTECIGLG